MPYHEDVLIKSGDILVAKRRRLLVKRRFHWIPPTSPRCKCSTVTLDIMKQFFFWPLTMMGIYLQTAEGTYCADNIYLRVGTRGVVSCNFGEFDVVGWLNPTEHVDTTPPFIYLEDSEISGPESTSGEYSMFPNGSLVITNVSLDHEKNYTVRIVTNGASVDHLEVCVKVYVLPNPEYPVVNGLTDQQRVIVHSSNGEASFNCTMDHIRPAVPLEVVFIPPTSGRVPMRMVPSMLNNSDGTYNVSLHVQLRGIIQLSGAYFLECRAVHSLAPSTALEVAEITLLLHDDDGRSFPVVEGLRDQQRVVLDINQGGKLNCFRDRVLPNANLTWELMSPTSSDELIIHPEISQMCDLRTCNITNNAILWATASTILYATLKCKLSVQGFTLSATTVEVIISQYNQQHIFPSVNGLDSQQHVVLDVKREGTLNCSLGRVPSNVELEWNYIKHDSSSRVALENRRHYSSDNGDGTYNITSIITYKATSDSIQCVTLKCGLSDSAFHLYTTVELNFPAADQQHIFPSVNGLDSQQHIVLDVKREGTLNCSLGRVPPNVELEWNYIKQDSSSRVALESAGHYSSDNGDGTHYITSITTYKATSDSIQCVTLKCGLSDNAVNLNSLYTTVELNFPTADSYSTCNTSHSNHLLGIVIAVVAVLAVELFFTCICFTIKTRKRTQENLQLKTRQHVQESEDLLTL